MGIRNKNYTLNTLFSMLDRIYAKDIIEIFSEDDIKNKRVQVSHRYYPEGNSVLTVVTSFLPGLDKYMVCAFRYIEPGASVYYYFVKGSVLKTDPCGMPTENVVYRTTLFSLKEALEEWIYLGFNEVPKTIQETQYSNIRILVSANDDSSLKEAVENNKKVKEDLKKHYSTICGE